MQQFADISGIQCNLRIESDSLEIVNDYEMGGEVFRVLQETLTNVARHAEATRIDSAGASGYMTKAAAPEHLVTAIYRLVEGMAYVSSSVARQLVCGKSSVEDKEPHELLSGREIDVLRAIASGVPLAKIASDMFISPKTVTTYRARIFDKLNLASNTELVRYALDHGLIR